MNSFLIQQRAKRKLVANIQAFSSSLGHSQSSWWYLKCQENEHIRSTCYTTTRKRTFCIRRSIWYTNNNHHLHQYSLLGQPNKLFSNAAKIDNKQPPPQDPLTLLTNIVSSTSIANKAQEMTIRYDEIMSNMMSNHTDNAINNHNDVITNSNLHSDTVTKELSSLAKVSKLYTDFKHKVDEMNGMYDLLIQAQELSDDDEQKEMIHECEHEIQILYDKLEDIGSKIVDSIIPSDENDYNCGAILEVRAGTGGDEATLFCGELLSCYQKVATSKGWVFDVLSKTTTDLKGVKEAAVSISAGSHGGGGGNYCDEGGDTPLGPYGFFKFESGVHRVQRVPVNDVRIHTSAASVAVLPAPSDEKGSTDNLLPSSELKIETMRASGAGGQHVNTTESAVRITHIPTGITASIQDERSQHKNKAKAMKLITARVRDKIAGDEARQRGDVKASLMGGGDRSERIRTYNFPQDRVTDHRCKHSEHGIEKLLSGGGGGFSEDTGLVSTFLPLMKKMERVELMTTLEEEEKKNSRM